MKIWKFRYKKSFSKDFKKLSKNQRIAWIEVLEIFYDNPFSTKLRRHKLKGKYFGFDSIDVCHDLRAIFLQSDNLFEFWYIKNHNQLYN